MAARDFQTRLTRRAGRAGLFLPEDLVEQLHTFYTLLSRWNEKINLTSLSDPDEAIDRLMLEPLLAARYLQSREGHLVDVGSGGGSPAIPLKLVTPTLSLTMIEVKTRKSAFLREAVRQLGLERTEVETARAEELLTRPDLHEAADVLTMRAVRLEGRVLNTLQAFLRPGGQVMLFRGPSGPEVPAVVVPPLEFRATQPLVDTLQSRLTVLGKMPIGSSPSVAFHVEHPRG